MRRSLTVAIVAGVATGALTTAPTAQAAVAPPLCAAPADRELRTDTLATFVPSCGLGFMTPATYEITTAPRHGAVRASRPDGVMLSIAYIPKAGYTGPDVFAYRARTAAGDSVPVTQRITIRDDVNTAPTCGPLRPPALRIGETRSFPLSCSDADGDAVAVDIAAAPAGVAAAIEPAGPTGQGLKIAARAGGPRTETVALRVSDGRTFTSVPVSLNVLAADANTAPTCFASFRDTEVVRDRPGVLWGPECADAEGDALAIEVVEAPANGTATGSALRESPAFGIDVRSVSYVPRAGFTGADRLTVRARDARGATSSPVSAPVRVVAPADAASAARAPFCWPASEIALRAGAATRVPISCSAASPWGTEIIDAPDHGAVIKRAGLYVYTPKPGFAGADSFSYRVLSAGGAGPEVRQALRVAVGVNTPPACWVSLPAVVRTGSSAPVSVTCSDSEEDPVTVGLADPPGGVVGALRPLLPEPFLAFTGESRYTPDAGRTGFDTVRIDAEDGRGGTSRAQQDITVVAATYNTAPSCSTLGAFPAVLIAGGEAAFDEGCFDPEGDPVRMRLIQPPKQVTFAGATGDRVPTQTTIRAPSGFTGVDTWFSEAVDDRGARSGWLGRSIRVIADPGATDLVALRGESVGADQEELLTPARPSSVRLTTLNEGRVRIVPGTSRVPTGYAAFGLAFDITAPDAIREAPMVLRFRMDASLRAAGEPAAAITVFRDGVAAGDCDGSGEAPAACVESRRELRGGDLEIVVRTPRAGAWAFGRTLAPTPGPGGGPIAGGPGAGVAPIPPVAGQGPGPSPLVRPPLVRVSPAARIGPAVARGVTVRVVSSYDGVARATLRLDGPTAKRLRLSRGAAVTVATGRAAVRAAVAGVVPLRFTARARRALPRLKRVTLRLQVRVGDGPAAASPLALRR